MILQKFLPALWLCGFLCALFFFNAYELESFGLSVLFLFVWSVVTLVPLKEWQVPKSTALLFMALFWLLAFTSLLHTDILNPSIMAFVYFSAMPLIFFTLVLRNDRTAVLVMAKGLAIIFAGLAIWALVQYFIFGEFFGGRAHHPLKNPNSLGALFNLGLFGAVGWMLVSKTKTQSNLALGLAILIFGGIVATASRGALVAMIPMMGLMLFIMREQGKAHWKCLGILAVAGIILFMLSAFGVAQNDTMLARMTDALSFNSNDITSNRITLWQASLEMVKTHGLFGTGIGTYFLYFPEFRLPSDRFGAYYAHNDPLQYWVELGFLGPVLFYGFCIAVLVRTIQAVKKTNDVMQRTKILAPFFALSAIVLHSHVTFNFYNLSILYVSGLTLAVWFLTTQDVLKTPIKILAFPSSYSIWARGAVISLPFVIIGFFFCATMLSEQLTQRAKAELIAGDFDKFAAHVMAAQRTGFGHNYRADLLAVNMPLTLLANASHLKIEERKEIFDQGLFYLRRAQSVNPQSASVYYNLGLIQEDVPKDFIPEDLKTPIEYYREALRLEPLHFSARIALSRTLPDQAAIALLEAGAHYRYNNPQAVSLYMALLARYAQTGQAAKMKQMAEKIRRLERSFEKDRQRASQGIFKGFSTKE